ncbi:hypothetical protein ASPACDRAFT_1858587 [Aspergillus aculeatus ATCC 16872]|uniref:Uncharacterized protein n=1 Tax=Aspergillus aculeatus (strain ATCC 16872 / CBS 172.66 / WB 5094) TaxID=690307 RepID=A0A1L9WLS3_ASPA1|nr:uncharacterized protein ASPACDRAFT_1858587 [Aspergillus aculeatus ATCC 16872]OJJ97125.1 hypothetical protein ASPACDRAFT_1858587 [Aspergillus aculeatus ATCC 16872]
MAVNDQATVAAPASCDNDFRRLSFDYEMQRQRSRLERYKWAGPPFSAIYAGSAAKFRLFDAVTFAFAVRDTSYPLDYGQYSFPNNLHGLADFILAKAAEYQEDHVEKFVGLAMSTELAERCPDLCARLWLELDIIPMVIRKAEENASWGSYDEESPFKTLDERAESIARKCLRFFGPNQALIPQIGSRGLVEVDAAFHVKMAQLSDYKKTVGDSTWSIVNKFAGDIKERKVKIAFFSATPQGGGVALMRHALVRFANAIGVDLKWYVPKPRPGVFRITKNNHNILQGVAPPGTRFTAQDKEILRDWVFENAERFWLKQSEPPGVSWLEKHALSFPALAGGADIIVIDDPQLPFLIPMIKQRTPHRPVIFRSHIQIRSDLTDTPGTPQAEAWELLWEAIEQADLFISHPVRDFVPNNVRPEKVGYMPATTDWLDGLNKPLSDWDACYYGRIFNAKCREQYMPNIDFPHEDYIVQIARFDPSKGIFDVLASYRTFHQRLKEAHPDLNPPKLLICGHGSVDDPDGTIMYDSALRFVDQHLAHIKSLICIMRIGPCDQVLNALLSKAKVALQLSTYEGFEVKVSEALHKGKPVIATQTGGIPLQVQHGKNGFLVNVSDTDAVAEHLFELWTDQELYDRMSRYAANSVSDEVSTVGNMLSWLYLASTLSKGMKIQPCERWIHDMAREEANVPYRSGENRLKRAVTPSTG